MNRPIRLDHSSGDPENRHWPSELCRERSVHEYTRLKTAPKPELLFRGFVLPRGLRTTHLAAFDTLAFIGRL